MADQLLSTDPGAGQLLSTDPAGGTAEAPLPVPRDRRGMPLVTSGTTDEPPTDLERMAHPQTLVDFARILTLPVDSVRRAMAMALTAGAARASAGPALSATGRGVETVGTNIAGPAKLATAYELASDPKRAILTYAAPRVLQAGGRLLQRVGAAVTPEIEATAAATPPAAAAAAEPVVDEFTAARSAKSAAANALPDQKALNEAALAARRAAYQAKLAAEAKGTANAIVPESGKMHFDADDYKEFLKFVNRGMSRADAEAAVRAAKVLGKDLPTTAEMKAAIAARQYKR